MGEPREPGWEPNAPLQVLARERRGVLNVLETAHPRSKTIMKNQFLAPRRLLLTAATVAATALSTAAIVEKTSMPAWSQEKTQSINAPDFPAGFAWHNVEKPLSLRALRGKVVLLDFWTYGCINCIHILPDLKKLERKYPNNLVVIGVHSAKFANESDSANIRNALLRYNIQHPIVVDQNNRLWDEYAVRAWPSFVLIDPAGKIVGTTAGEGQYDLLDKTIAKTIEAFRKRGDLNEKPLKLALEAAKVAPTPLWYPGKVLAREGYVFIADSNHNRIVIARPDGKVEAVAGSGVMGKDDGSFGDATFSNPQGLALQKAANGDLTLFVADTNNHLIRALDLKKGTVKTIAGTGAQARYGASGGVGTEAAISSPWGLELIGDTLYIAMAGPHQIWDLDLKTRKIGVYAGSGREARLDGPLKSAAFAQPSGLTTDGQHLLIADSEISAIRQIDLPGNGNEVKTLAGGDLFDFGDRDGRGDNVRLQHPLGVAWQNGTLYFADTYNNKIKTLDPKTGQVTSFLGNGRGDKSGNAPQFYEPGGLSIDGDKLYVADTNNNKIKVINLPTKAVSDLTLRDLPPVRAAEPERPVRPINEDQNTITLAKTVLKPNSKGEVVFDVQLPALHHLNAESPQRVQARIEGSGAKLGNALVAGTDVKLPLRLPLTVEANGTGSVILSAAIYYCTDESGLCKFKTLRFRAPFEVAENGAETLKIGVKIDD